MAGIKIKPALKSGEKFTGQVVEVMDSDGETANVIFETKDKKRIKMPFPTDVADTINEDHNGMFGGDIITVSRNGEEYDIEERDAWPEEK